MEDITWWGEDMNFMFEWQKQCERVRNCFCRENIKFISSSQHAMFLLYRQKLQQRIKSTNLEHIVCELLQLGR